MLNLESQRLRNLKISLENRANELEKICQLLLDTYFFIEGVASGGLILYNIAKGENLTLAIVLEFYFENEGKNNEACKRNHENIRA